MAPLREITSLLVFLRMILHGHGGRYVIDVKPRNSQLAVVLRQKLVYGGRESQEDCRKMHPRAIRLMEH